MDVQSAGTVTGRRPHEAWQETGRKPLEPEREAALRATAQKLEASFLSEMLKSTGLGQESESFGGGAGESQFSSFLIEAQAEGMAKAGGIGLAESIFQSLKERE